MKPATYQSGVLCPFLWSLLSFPIWGQCQISPRDLLRLQTNIGTQKIVFHWYVGKVVLEECQAYTRCFMNAYLILHCVRKIILAYSLAYTRCSMQVCLLPLCVGALYLSNVSYILGANACMPSPPCEWVMLYEISVWHVPGVQCLAWLNLCVKYMNVFFSLLRESCTKKLVHAGS